jgi:ABC-type multidrug transport system fused ATPase/permease subunit
MHRSGNVRVLLKEILALFPMGFRRRLYLFTVLQALAGIIDLIGVLLFGLVGSITITTIQSSEPNQSILAVTKFLNISSYSAQQQVIFLSTISLSLLITKSLFASFLQKKTMSFLSNAGVDLTVSLVKKMLNSTLERVRNYTEKQSLFAVTSGVEEMTLRVIGASIAILADAILMTLLGAVLFVSSPHMAITMLGIFSAFFVLIQRLVNRKARLLGSGVTRTTIKSNEIFSTSYSAFKELVVRGQTSYIVEKLRQSRQESAKFQAETAFLPFVSKYLMEAAVLTVGFALAAVSFMTSNAAEAAGKLGLFFIASTRIAPALMRVQQSVYSLNMGAAPAAETVKFAQALQNDRELSITQPQSPDIRFDLVLNKCSYSFPGQIEDEVLSEINLVVPQNSRVAIVGPSGSGKTTLVNLVLGLIEPTAGAIQIAGIPPRHLANSIEGCLGYVPQDPYIANDSIRENVTLGYQGETFSDEEIWSTLDSVNLRELRGISDDNLNAIIGETGIKLSGGQKQKLAIARVALRKPRLLVLDEATSSLDADSEFTITSLVETLFEKSTVITIAHRLSTIIEYPRIIYIQNGRILGEGTFTVLRNKIQDFDNQARKLGL